MKQSLETVPFIVPNFVGLRMPPRRREEGFIEGPKLALAEVDADVLGQMCDDFRAEIFRKSGKPDPEGVTR